MATVTFPSKQGCSCYLWYVFPDILCVRDGRFLDRNVSQPLGLSTQVWCAFESEFTLLTVPCPKLNVLTWAEPTQAGNYTTHSAYKTSLPGLRRDLMRFLETTYVLPWLCLWIPPTQNLHVGLPPRGPLSTCLWFIVLEYITVSVSVKGWEKYLPCHEDNGTIWSLHWSHCLTHNKHSIDISFNAGHTESRKGSYGSWVLISHLKDDETDS